MHKPKNRLALQRGPFLRTFSIWVLALCLGPILGSPAQGQVNLKEWDGQPLELNRSWDVHAGIISVDDWMKDPDARRESRPVLITTPFSKIDKLMRPVNSLDSVTFTLELRDLEAGEYGIRLRADTAAAVWIADTSGQQKSLEPALLLGKVGDSPSSSIPEVADRLGRFVINQKGNHTLIVQVSNHHYAEGQVWKAPKIGKYEIMKREWVQELIAEIFTLGIIFILTIYNIALYFNRKEDPSNLWLAGYCLCSLLRFVGMSGFFLPSIFAEPSVQLHQFMRIAEIGFPPFASSCLLHFSIENFGKKAFWKSTSAWHLRASLLFLLVSVVVDVKYLPSLIIVLDMILGMGVVISIGLMWKALKRKQTGAMPLFVGLVLFALFILHDVAAGLQVVNTHFYLANFGLALFVFFQGQTVAQLFAQAFRTAKTLSEHLEEEVDRKTRDIQSLLNNIPLGICSLDQHGQIMPNYSSQLNTMLEATNLQGQNIFDVVFSRSNLNSNAIDLARQSILSCFGEDILNYEVNAVHLPSEIELTINGNVHYLQCIWNPIADRTSAVARILLVLRDITSLKRAEVLRMDQQKELEYIIELVNVTPTKFQTFVTSSSQLLGENDRLIRQNSAKDDEIIKIIFVNMHTIKGGARTLGLLKLTALLHDVEQIYSHLLKEPSAVWNQARRLHEMTEVKALLDYYVQLNFGKLGRIAAKEEEISVDRHLLQRQNQVLRTIKTCKLEPDDVQKLHSTISQIEDLCFDDASDVFLDILSNVHRVAKDLGKEKPDILVQAQGFKLTLAAQKLLSNVFVHIIRNSLDHGIEKASERLAAGKLPTGRIQVTLRERDGHLEIIYKDDGRGLNIKKLREKGEREGLLPASELNNVSRIAELIFHPGISTAAAISEVSGRGIGMNAVKQYIEEQGGSIVLDTEEEKDGFAPFSMRIKLDSKLFIKSIETQKTLLAS